MKIVYTDGCIVSGLDVDGEDFMNLPTERKKELCHKLIDGMDDIELKNMVINYAEVSGEYKHLYTCEDCGDSVCSWTVEL